MENGNFQREQARQMKYKTRIHHIGYIGSRFFSSPSRVTCITSRKKRVSFSNVLSSSNRERREFASEAASERVCFAADLDKAIVTERSRIIISGQLNASRRAAKEANGCESVSSRDVQLCHSLQPHEFLDIKSDIAVCKC